MTTTENQNYLPIHHTHKKLLLFREFAAVLNKLLNFAHITGSGFAVDAFGNTQETKTSGYAVMFTDTPFDNSKRVVLVSSAINWLLSPASLRGAVGDIQAERVAGLWFQTAGEAFFDLGVNVESLYDAIEIAKKYNQRAIWDYAQKAAVDIGDAETILYATIDAPRVTKKTPKDVLIQKVKNFLEITRTFEGYENYDRNVPTNFDRRRAALIRALTEFEKD